MTPAALTELRVHIDAVDAQIIALLGERFRHTAAVGALKSAQQMPATDAGREAAQALRIATLAAEHGVDVDLAQRVFRTVIDHVVAQHKVAGALPESNDAC